MLWKEQAVCPVQLEQVANFSDCQFPRCSNLKNRNNKFYLIEFLKRGLTELTYDNLFLRDSEIHVKE